MSRSIPLERSTTSPDRFEPSSARSCRLSPTRPAELHFSADVSRTSIAFTRRCWARGERSTRSATCPPTKRQTERGARSKSRLHVRTARTFVFALERDTTVQRKGDVKPAWRRDRREGDAIFQLTRKA